MDERRLKVLLIGHDLPDAEALGRTGAGGDSGGFELERAAGLAEGLGRLEAGGADVVLLGAAPVEGWPEAVSRVRAAAPRTPVVVIGAGDADGADLRAIEAGAQDYLVRTELDGPSLRRSIRRAAARARAGAAPGAGPERDLLHALLDHLPARLYFKDEQSRFVRVSRSLARLLGLDDPRQVLGKSDFDFFRPEHAGAALADEQRVMRTGRPLAGKLEEELFLDGRAGWALSSKAPWRDARGRVVGTLGVAHDVTDAKKMEDALAEERNLLRSLIDSLPHQIYVKDRDSRFLLTNAPVREFFGAGAEMVGKSDFDFFPAATAASFRAEEVEILEGRLAGVNREGIVTRPDGQEAWVFTTKVPLRNSRGRIVALAGANRDITERKRGEAQLKRAHAALAVREQELLAALADLSRSHEELIATQLQLVQAEKMESIGRLAAGIAHEVKNPLAIIALGLDYLSHGVARAAGEAARAEGAAGGPRAAAGAGEPDDAAPGPGATDENVPVVLRSMQDAVRRADAVVKGLLNFSVPKALETADADLNVVVEQSLSFVKHELVRQKISLRKSLAASLPLAALDGNKIKQVFVNLFMNAVHATPEGGALTVRTFARRVGPSDPYVGDRAADRFRAGDAVVVAEVDDTGPGIPEEKLPKVFDPFFTTKTAGKGTGLGLTVTKTIVDLHGGVIQLRNRPEGGVRATLTFKAVAE